MNTVLNILACQYNGKSSAFKALVVFSTTYLQRALSLSCSPDSDLSMIC